MSGLDLQANLSLYIYFETTLLSTIVNGSDSINLMKLPHSFHRRDPVGVVVVNLDIRSSHLR